MLRPANSARARCRGRDRGPKTAARAPCGHMHAASLRHGPAQAAAKGVAFRTGTTRPLLTAARGNAWNAPRLPNVGGPGAGRSPGAGRERQRAGSGGVACTLELRHELRRALNRVGTSELGRGGRVGRRRVALQPRQPAPHAFLTSPLPTRLNAEPRQVPEHPHVRGDAHCGLQARCLLARAGAAPSLGGTGPVFRPETPMQL